MQLHASPLSPYVRKVRILILEKGLSDKVDIVDTNPYESSDELLRANPLSKIPTLILDNGQSLYDSNVICEYLDGLDGPALFPEKDQRILALKHLALTDGLLQSTFNIAMERLRRPENERSPAWLKRWTESLERGVDALAAAVPDLGDALTFPHIGTVCALDYLSFRAGDRLDWTSRQPSLVAWYAQFGERPVMVSTRPA